MIRYNKEGSMRKILILLTATLLSSIAIAQPTDTTTDTTTPATAPMVHPAMMPQSDNSSSKECDTIANACLSAGYDNTTTDKRFWQDCMRALLVNQSVNGVSISSSDVAVCRDFKITKMQQELQDLQNAKTQTPAQ